MNKYLEFYKPFLEYIDSGNLFRTPFSWLYAVFAGLNLLFPVIVLYVAIDNRLFSMGASFFFGVILLLVFIVAACWLGFQIWWNRRRVLLSHISNDAEFVATPVFCHFIQTFGEWLGSFMAIVGAGAGLITGIFMGGRNMSYLFPIPFLGGGFISVLLMPILGFLIIVLSRFIAEQWRALAAIANNTKPVKPV